MMSFFVSSRQRYRDTQGRISRYRWQSWNRALLGKWVSRYHCKWSLSQAYWRYHDDHALVSRYPFLWWCFCTISSLHWVPTTFNQSLGSNDTFDQFESQNKHKSTLNTTFFYLRTKTKINYGKRHLNYSRTSSLNITGA